MPPSTSASSGAAMLPPVSTAVIAVGPDEHHRAEAEDERHQVEEADEAGRVEHRAARRPRVGHGVEAHQDVRQPGGAEHERHAERDRVERVRRRACPGASTRVAVLRGRRGEERQRVHPKCASTSSASSAGAAQQQHRLDDLHPGRRDHPAEEHVGDHRHADDHDRRSRSGGRTSAGSGCPRRPSARSGRRSRSRACRCAAAMRTGVCRRRQRDDVGERVLAEVAQRLGDQEQHHRPADEPAGRVDQAVEARGRDQPGDAEEATRRSCSRRRARSRSARPLIVRPAA